jgi:DNA-binding LacI/PurR family transcriptional regulator
VSRQATPKIIADHVLSGRRRPALTTVRQDVDAQGRAAAGALRTAIQHARAGRPVVPEHVLLPAELVVRETTAAR